MPSINPVHQLVILTRLQEFCRFQGMTLNHEADPWGYMRRKLMEVEEPMLGLKTDLLSVTKTKFLQELRAGKMTEDRYSDFKLLFERLLAPGDFADLAIHLTEAAAGPAQISNAQSVLGQVKPVNFFEVERKPPESRSPSWEKLVQEFTTRLDIDSLEKALTRKPRTNRRKLMVLRRLRANVAHYCGVLHIPTSPEDTFTPFMLPRVEAMVAASLRFLNKYR